MKYEDELLPLEEYGEDYTIKIYKKMDCKYYALVVYETDTEAKVIYTSKATTMRGDAKRIAIKNAQKHESENKK